MPPVDDTALAELRARVARAEFTPGARHVPTLVAWVLDGGDDARAALTALGRAAAAAIPALASATANATHDVPARVRALEALGRLPGDAADAALVAALGSDEAALRRAAARALGRRGRADAPATALAEALAHETDAAARRALVEALGKVGGAVGARALADEDGAGASRARLIATRDALREGAPSTIRQDVPPPSAAPLTLDCRGGLEGLLAEELRAVRGVRVLGVRPGGVDTILTAPLSALYAARTWASAAFRVLRGRAARAAAEDDVTRAVALLTSPVARQLFAAYTDGPVRLRIVFAGAGHRRALTWAVAEALATRAPELVNDSREAPWTATIALADAGDTLELAPRLDDPRFAWRRADVPAASHPTIAAALARLAAPTRDDLVWDPFVGSGAELVECARLAPGVRCLGTDIDTRALAAASENLGAAGVTASLTRGDALTFAPSPAPTLVISNPPMGRRVRRGDVASLLEQFVLRLPTLLAPGGRLVWASALPGRTRAAAQRAGLSWQVLAVVDMGGFTADVQELRRRR